MNNAEDLQLVSGAQGIMWLRIANSWGQGAKGLTVRIETYSVLAGELPRNVLEP